MAFQNNGGGCKDRSNEKIEEAGCPFETTELIVPTVKFIQLTVARTMRISLENMHIYVVDYRDGNK